MVAKTRTKKRPASGKRSRKAAVRANIPSGCHSPESIPKRWRELLRNIPGYDSVLQSKDCFFDPRAAQDAIDFFEQVLTHSEGSLDKSPFLLEPWQKSIVANLFGWKRIDSIGRVVRRYRTLFLYVPRKNGKTPFAAGLCLYMLTCDGEAGAQISSSAAQEEQAALLYSHACGMVKNSNALQSLCQIYEGRGSRAIRLRSDTRSMYRVHTSSPKGKHGGNPHMVLVDELHEVDERAMIDAYETSFASQNRAQPLLVYITTADYDRPSICNEKYKKACRVRDNDGDPLKPGYDPSYLPVVYETNKKADWKDLKTWQRCNPNLGISVSLDYAKQAIKDATEDPTKLTELCRVNLNMITQTAKFWLDLDHWDAGAGLLKPEALEGLSCFGGLDLASISDLTAFVALFPHGDDLFSVVSRFWVPEDTVRQRSERDGIPYDAWVRQGWLLTTPGNSTDYAKVREDIYAISNQYGLRKIAIDRLFQGEECAQKLKAEGLDVVAHGQGFYDMAAPTKRFEQLYLNRRFIHDGSPITRWMLGNAMYEQDPAGNRKPSKKHSSEKIDFLPALIMSISMWTEGLSQRKSVYEDRGLITIHTGEDQE